MLHGGEKNGNVRRRVVSVGVWAAAEVAVFDAPVEGRIERWGTEGIIELRIATPADAEAAVARLERALDREQQFGVLVEGLPDMVHLQRMLAQAPGARRRLRRMRPGLGAWCAGVAHVVPERPRVLWPAEVLWGCRATVTPQRESAQAWLRARLAG